MPFNGSGTFDPPAPPAYPPITGTVISSTYNKTVMQDVFDGLTNCVTRDGQSPPTANLPMGSNKLTGLANGSAPTDSTAYGQLTAETTRAEAAEAVLGTAITTGDAASVATSEAFTTSAIATHNGAVGAHLTASTSQRGMVTALATAAEVTTGTDNLKAVTPLAAQALAILGTIAATGTITLPNGLIIKWGETGTRTTEGVETVNFAAAFPTGCLWAGAVMHNPTAGLGATFDVFAQIQAFSATQLMIVFNDSSVGGFSAMSAFWIAFGH